MLTDRDRYELQLAHQRAQGEDARKRLLNRLDVEAHWPATVAWIDHVYENRMAAA